MNIMKLKRELEARLSRPEWEFSFDKEKESIRVEDRSSRKGITVALGGVLAKYQQKKNDAIDEIVYYVEEALTAMSTAQQLNGKEKQIFPVIRSTSFPTETEDGRTLIFDDHTAETRIYYALDLGTTYRLIDSVLAEKENWSHERIREVAKFNIRSLKIRHKEDSVAGNTFYFFNSNDGYDASRILNESLLNSFSEKITGKMLVAVPHQDVLIIADIQNETGYDIMAQMAMSFFANGRVPVTALSFFYENGELEPVFILGKNRPVK